MMDTISSHRSSLDHLWFARCSIRRMLRGRRWRARAVSLYAMVAIAGGAATAGAQSSGNQAAAEALFKQGRDLMASGHLAEACPKLAESQRLDPGTGTLLNLATCYERNGQVASAWVTYKEAATAAQNADQPERAQLARRKAAELEPRLPTLTIVVPAAADRPDLEIRRDGEAIGRPGWGVPIPVDPGVHSVEAKAAGRKAWQGQASVEGAAPASIEVPPLAETTPDTAAPPAPASGSPAGAASAPPAPQPVAPMPPPAPAAGSHGSGQRVIGLVTGAVGLAGLVVGTTFGVIAGSDNNDAKTHCPTDSTCTAQGVASTTSALHAATASTVAFVAGGALTAVGLVLYLTAPSDGPRSSGRIGLSPLVGAATGGVTLHGGW